MQPLATAVAWYVSVCVCLSVGHKSNSYQNRDAVWAAYSGGPKEPCIRWLSGPPGEEAILGGSATLL